MKVRIKTAPSNFWYFNFIGKEFNVESHPFDEELYRAEEGGALFKADCEVIPEEDEVDKAYREMKTAEFKSIESWHERAEREVLERMKKEKLDIHMKGFRYPSAEQIIIPDSAFEDRIKTKLLIRGFSNEIIINNRGLIGAVIDEVILDVIKNKLGR